MTQSLAHPRCAALSAGGKTFPHAGLIYLSLLDEEPINIDALGILGIRYCGAHRLGNDACRALGSKLENVERFLDTLTADLVYHQAHFAG